MLKTLFLIFGFFPGILFAQENFVSKPISKRGAIVRNLILPGWGHQYAAGGKSAAGRGFLYADVVLLTSYLGLSAQANHLEGNLSPFAAQHAGVSIDGKSRLFVLAVTNYNSLAEYNAEMLRRRQWNALLDETPENTWQWSSEADRVQFVRLKDRFDRVEQNKPALVSMLVLNRLIASVSVYRNLRRENPVSVSVTGTSVRNPVLSVHIPF